jgi:ABC-2 type transport system ATP-binding protein
MAEADELCDRLAIIDQGKVIVCDSPSNLKKGLVSDAVFHIDTDLMLNNMERFKEMRGIKSFAFDHKSALGKTSFKFILEEDAVITELTDVISQNGSKILSLSKVEATLEDVFVSLVGKGLENENGIKN